MLNSFCNQGRTDIGFLKKGLKLPSLNLFLLSLTISNLTSYFFYNFGKLIFLIPIVFLYLSSSFFLFKNLLLTHKEKSYRNIIIYVLLTIIICYLNISPLHKLKSLDIPDTISNFNLKIDRADHLFNKTNIEGVTNLNNKSVKVYITYLGHEKIKCRDIIKLKSSAKRIIEAENQLTLQKLLKGTSYNGIAYENDLEIVFKSRQKVSSKIKDHIDNKINNLFKEKNTSALVKSLLIGNRRDLQSETFMDFKQSGIIHLLAISGLHLSIIILIPLFILRKIMQLKYCLLLSSILVILYLFITGSPVSMLRCSIMYFMLIVELFLMRERNSMNLLFLTGFIITFLFPWEIYSLSFQLSMAATGGIVIFFKKFMVVTKIKNKYIRSSIAITLSAQLFTTPILWFYFSEITTSGIISNIVIIPLITVLIIVSITALALSGVTAAAAHLLAGIGVSIYSMICSMTKFISQIKLCFYNENPLYLLITVLLMVFLLFRFKKVYKKTAIFLLLLLSPILFAQADSFIAPEKQKFRNIIIKDSIHLNKNYQYSSKNLISYINKNNLEINSLIIDHSTNKNTKTAIYLIQNIRLKNIVVHKISTTPNMQKLLYLIDKNNIKIILE